MTDDIRVVKPDILDNIMSSQTGEKHVRHVNLSEAWVDIIFVQYIQPYNPDDSQKLDKKQIDFAGKNVLVQ